MINTATLLACLTLITLGGGYEVTSTESTIELAHSVNILYVTFHSGTRVNMDAIGYINQWNITHIRPANGYKMTRYLAEDVWQNHYKPFIDNHSPPFTHIIACDTIAAAAYPFLLHSHEISNITIILEITNYFDYENFDNYEYINDMKLFIHKPNVKVVCVDKYCLTRVEILLNFPSHLIHYIPLHGLVTPHRFPFFDVGFSNISLDYYIPDVYYDNHEVKVPNNKVFISSRHNCPYSAIQNDIYTKFDNIDILTHASYGGPLSLQEYDGVIYIPYHYSTMSLQEYLTLGLFVYIPSPNLTNICFNNMLHVHLMDVYTGPLTTLLTYYDSIEELYDRITSLVVSDKLQNIVYKNERKRIMEKYNLFIIKKVWIDLLLKQ